MNPVTRDVCQMLAQVSATLLAGSMSVIDGRPLTVKQAVDIALTIVREVHVRVQESESTQKSEEGQP